MPLQLLIIVIVFPVAIPIAIVLHMRDRLRMRAAAERTRCKCCGAPLAVASLRRADTEWAKRATALQHARSITRLRLVRHVWAICAACGVEYDYDTRADTFLRVVHSGVPDDQGKADAS
jgi:RNase P subunit RPR2